MSVWTWCRERPWTWSVAAGLGGVACGAVVTGYAMPTREEWRSVVSIQTNEVEVEKVVERIVEVKGPVRTITRVVERVVPSECAGVPPIILTDTETIVDSGPTTTTTDTARDERRELEQTGVTATEHTVERSAPRLTVGIKGGFALDSMSPTWGAFGLVRVLGPLSIGTDYTRQANIVMGSVALTF